MIRGTTGPRGLTIFSAGLVSALLALPANAGSAPDALSLADALESALLRNADVGAARREARAAAARVDQARGEYFPRLFFSAGYTRYEEPNIIIPIHEGGVFPPLDDGIYSGAANLEVPLFDGGRTAAALREAKARAEGAAAREDLSETELLVAVGRVFVRADEQADRRDLLRARLESLGERREEVERLFHEGRAARSDLDRVLSAIEEVRAESIDVESGAFELAVRLGRLVGRGDPVRPEPAAREVRIRGGGIPGGPEDPIEGPRLRWAEADLRGAEAARSRTKRAFLPAIDGFAAYALRSGDPPDPVGEWSVGVGLRIPLFDGWRLVPAARAASEAEAAARERVRAERQSQDADLRVAFDRWKAAGERRGRLGEAIRGKESVVSLTRKLYEEGRVPLSELMTEESELLSLEMKERGAAHAGRVAALDYYGVLGDLKAEFVVNLLGNQS